MLKNGQLATGRTKIGDQFYFFNKYNGLKETDVLRKSGGKWYYFGENGVQNTLMPDYYTIEEAPRVAHPVFNKDGSLKGFEDNFGKKITNASITSLDPWEMIQSNAAYNLGHIATLDKSGKPMTGIVTFNSYVNDEHYGKGWVRLMLEDDGSLYAQGSDYFPALLLIKSGKQYLCVGQGFVGSDALADGEFYVREVSDAFLPAADREAIKGLVQLSVHSYGEQGHLYIVANNRGEVQTSSSLSIDGGLLHTNRYGMPMELYSWLVKVGKEWIIPDFGSASTSIEVVVRGADMGGTIPAVMNVKGGVLTGFVDENGKALNGAYVLPWDDALVVLKNGLPQTGKQKISVGYGTILSLTIDPEAGWINTTFLGA